MAHRSRRALTRPRHLSKIIRERRRESSRSLGYFIGIGGEGFLAFSQG